jgi:hypothetical protein
MFVDTAQIVLIQKNAGFRMGGHIFPEARHVGVKEFTFILMQIMGDLHEMSLRDQGHINAAASSGLHTNKGDENVVCHGLDF